MSKLGVALLGLDHWYAALHLAPSIARSGQTQLVAVADDDAARARQVAGDYGAELATSDYQSVLERDDVAIVVALYSSDRNVAICQAAAAAGKHIIAVKPMALDLAGATAILEAVRAAGVHYLPFECGQRLGVQAQRIKRWITEGRIGTPLRYAQTLHGSLPQAWPGSSEHGWWIDPARVPGGAWIDHAIYAVDMVRWLLDSALLRVQGVVANQRYQQLALEDYGLASFTLASGALASIEDTWTAAPGASFSRSEIVGSAGSIMDYTGMTGQLLLRGDFGYDGWLTLQRQQGQQATLVEHLAACVREECAPIASAEDGRANLAACLAFYQAARSGAAVEL